MVPAKPEDTGAERPSEAVLDAELTRDVVQPETVLSEFTFVMS